MLGTGGSMLMIDPFFCGTRFATFNKEFINHCLTLEC